MLIYSGKMITLGFPGVGLGIWQFTIMFQEPRVFYTDKILHYFWVFQDLMSAPLLPMNVAISFGLQFW